MSGVNFTAEDYLNVCRTQPVEVKSLLIDELDFTVDGLKEVHERRPEESSVFFSEFIGEVFTATDGQIVKVLEKGFSGPGNMANVMQFMYNNQKEKEKESSAMESTSTVGKEKGKGRGRSKTDWASKETPFAEGTKKCVIFKELLKFGADGSSVKGFLEHIETVFKQNGLVSRNLKLLVSIVVKDIPNRGWNFSIVDDKYRIEKAS